MNARTFVWSCLLLVCLSLLASAYELPATCVRWSSARPLTWSDFLSPPPANASDLIDVAAIHMTIHWSASYAIRNQGGAMWVGTVQGLSVVNAMDTARSWVVANRQSAQALSHEQTHFNLNEVYRRKVELALRCLQTTGPTAQAAESTLAQRLHQTADAILDHLAEIQGQYDRETRHGSDAAKQAEWDQRVLRWLAQPTLAP
ncbi:MAG: DUF922 domain-containing protein [Candidatus Bipolaricaulis sp.]|nr:DUF922 domain-containing protein [Candidatus Bipolaricaulis sp.]